MTISAEELRRLFSYEPETGRFRRLIKRSPKNQDYPCLKHSRGYRQLPINGKLYLIHRLVWLHVYGYMPEQIDHINGDRTDNRLCNLREATQSLNNANCARRVDNTSGAKGVFWNSRRNCWQARIKPPGQKRVYLGRFEKIEDAAAAYERAATVYFGQYARAA